MPIAGAVLTPFRHAMGFFVFPLGGRYEKGPPMNPPAVKIPKKSRNENHPQRPGFLRLRQIIGDRSNPGPIPVSASTWWTGVRSGRFPQPVRLGPRITVWKSTDICALIEDTSAAVPPLSESLGGRAGRTKNIL